MENILAYIANFISISDELKSRLYKIYVKENLPKDYFLYKPNKIWRNTYFINKGIVRSFHLKNEKEITDNFWAENEWITSTSSFLENIPNLLYIKTVEQTELIRFSLSDLEECLLDFPEMERFGRIIVSKNLSVQYEQLIILRSCSAQERYHFFEKTARNKLPRIPLGMLASFLGMANETLSRVRSPKYKQ
ncbi:Crp/Fnr family transcriptional regulator [Muriicola sp. Z0-33]|uniref:Crp/Fnr family transcriptional regulator n=1 Tax=Muriicola sp. Z0-33 TaxID=2816957 RepID=UPI002237F737|nr:Crp/Fnr family transcriptional regulator [Muriicola sp. Z0-33]MCW5516952.1 Crp/Fnr family transcriptional regulator [Muriicola sp. Z0-33]